MKRGRESGLDLQEACVRMTRHPAYAEWRALGPELNPAKAAYLRMEVDAASMHIDAGERSRRITAMYGLRGEYNLMAKRHKQLRAELEESTEYADMKRAAAGVPGGDDKVRAEVGL